MNDIDWKTFLWALRWKESRNKPEGQIPRGDGGNARGPLQIHEGYHHDAIGDKWAYEEVEKWDRAVECFFRYMGRYCKGAMIRKDFETLARVHNGGPAQLNPAKHYKTNGYWTEVWNEMQRIGREGFRGVAGSEPKTSQAMGGKVQGAEVETGKQPVIEISEVAEKPKGAGLKMLSKETWGVIIKTLIGILAVKFGYDGLLQDNANMVHVAIGILSGAVVILQGWVLGFLSGKDWWEKLSRLSGVIVATIEEESKIDPEYVPDQAKREKAINMILDEIPMGKFGLRGKLLGVPVIGRWILGKILDRLVSSWKTLLRSEPDLLTLQDELIRARLKASR